MLTIAERARRQEDECGTDDLLQVGKLYFDSIFESSKCGSYQLVNSFEKNHLNSTRFCLVGCYIIASIESQ